MSEHEPIEINGLKSVPVSARTALQKNLIGGHDAYTVYASTFWGLMEVESIDSEYNLHGTNEGELILGHAERTLHLVVN